MTFSIAGRCARSGAFGVAIATSSIAVGARCPHARSGIGAVATQNVTDPALGLLVLDHLELGLSAKEAIAAALRDRPHTDYRQLTAVDSRGRSASFTGRNILGTNAVSEQQDCVAAGNLLKSTAVPRAMTARFAQAAQQHLAERLLQSLETGLEAGGEEGPAHSSALIVYDRESFPLVSLRCDWDEQNPIAALRALWTAYEPQMEAYRMRALDPAKSPTYGVPGDL